MFYEIIKHMHSGFRWIVLLFLVAAILVSLVKLVSNKRYSTLDKKLSLFTFMFMNLQFVIGLILYFVSGKVVFSTQSLSDDMLRFFLVEHLGMMLIALAFISIGYSSAKRAVESKVKLKRTLIYFGLGLVVIYLAIPWPWQMYSATWF